MDDVTTEAEDTTVPAATEEATEESAEETAPDAEEVAA